MSNSTDENTNLLTDASDCSEVVNRWLYQQGNAPSDEQIVVHLKWLADEWLSDRRSGFDALASSERDNLKGLIDAMGGLI